MAGAYSSKTLSSYLAGVRAWHILYGLTWSINEEEVTTMLHAAKKLAPPHSKRKKCRPYTPDFIMAVKAHLTLSTPLNAVVFACLTTCFYAAAWLGEFTVPCLDAFNPTLHVTSKNLSKDQDRQGNELTILHLPCTKVSVEGEDVHWHWVHSTIF